MTRSELRLCANILMLSIVSTEAKPVHIGPPPPGVDLKPRLESSDPAT